MTVTVSAHTCLIIVSVLVSFGLALVRADQQVEVVDPQHLLRDVGAEVAAAAAKHVRLAPKDVLRVAPEQVQHLFVTHTLRLHEQLKTNVKNGYIR